jgi:tetratricopeptide (TPR) repeat protein
VPPLLKELNEIVAYLEYEKALEPFRAALSENNPAKYREAIDLFRQVIEGYPNTESVIGALSNMGICYENLKEWRQAVTVYDQVLSRYIVEEEEATLPDAYRFAKAHRDWIVANRL